LVKILQDAELPSNTTVESTNEGDEHNDVFVSYLEPVSVEKTSKVAPNNKPKATKTSKASKASNVENKENTNETPACQKCKKQVFRACYRESCTNRICIFCFKIKLNANDNIYCTRACKSAD